jgi:DNA repair protein RadC
MPQQSSAYTTTRRVMMGIPVHDHVIIAGGRYTSMAQTGAL